MFLRPFLWILTKVQLLLPCLAHSFPPSLLPSFFCLPCIRTFCSTTNQSQHQLFYKIMRAKFPKSGGNHGDSLKKTINERRKCFYKINWFWFGSPQDASSTRGWTPHPSLAKQASFAQESSLGIIFANSSDKSNANGRADRDPMERTEATEAMEARWQGHPLQLALAEESAKT